MIGIAKNKAGHHILLNYFFLFDSLEYYRPVSSKQDGGILLLRDNPAFSQICCPVTAKFQGPESGKGVIQRSPCFTIHDTEITVPPVGHP